MKTIIEILITLLLFPVILLLGFLAVRSIVREQKLPADESNRFNKMILIWNAFNREEEFVEFFPWMKYDVWESLKIWMKGYKK